MTVTVTTLANGVRIASDAMPGVESVSVGVWAGVGARHEPAPLNGISHLLEHMAFKGTRRRSAQIIAEEIEAVGGHLDAYTGREATAYIARVLKDDLPLAMDLLGDILRASVFDEAELARERTVILQEIAQANDTPDDIVFDNCQAAAFPDQALGRPVLGQAANVRAIGRDALVGYLDERYRGGTLVVAAAGAVDHDRLTALAEAAFGDLPGGSGPAPDLGSYRGGDHRDRRDLEQMHLVLAFPGVGIRDPLYSEALVYATVLGGGMSSRLFQEVREKRGLAYSVQAHASAYSECGLIKVYAGTAPEDAPELVPVLFGEMTALATGATEEEVARAKAQLRAGLLMGLESSGARTERLAQDILVFGRPLSIAEILSQLEAVDAAAIRRRAEATLAGPLTCAAVGPLDTLEDHASMLARMAPAG